MMRADSRRLIPALVCALSLTIAARAHAHRFGGPNDPCERKLGASLLHITLYQPEFDPDAEYCDEVPREGNTVFVIDTMGDELRRVPIGVRIFAVDSAGSRRLALEIAPAVYRRGVVDTQLNLAEGQSYLMEVTVRPEDAANPLQYSFPIRVRPWYRALVMPCLLVLGVLALVAVSVFRYQRSAARPAARRRAVAARLAWTALLAGIFICGCHPSAQESPSLPDVQLIDAHGNPVALGSLKGKVVLLDFVHVGCPGVCDNLTNKFGQIADALRPEMGTRLVLVTVTNDPQHDRPEQLLKLARDRQADMSGWLFLTGNPEDVGRVISAFGVDNRRLPDGSPNHITRVFVLDRDLRKQREYAGMAMDSRTVAAELKSEVERGGA